MNVSGATQACPRYSRAVPRANTPAARSSGVADASPPVTASCAAGASTAAASAAAATTTGAAGAATGAAGAGCSSVGTSPKIGAPPTLPNAKTNVYSWVTRRNGDPPPSRTRTTEVAVEAVWSNDSSSRCRPPGPSSARFAPPQTPEAGSPTPQPSHRQPGEVESLPVGRYSSPASPGPAADPVPSRVFSSPVGLTASRTSPLSMQTAGAHGSPRAGSAAGATGAAAGATGAAAGAGAASAPASAPAKTVTASSANAATGAKMSTAATAVAASGIPGRRCRRWNMVMTPQLSRRRCLLHG